MADQSTPTIQQKGGNVGISTASPKSRLDLSPPASQSTVSTLGYSANAQLNIRIPNSVGDVGQIVFTNDAAPTAGYASIGVVMTSGAGVGLGDIIMSTKSVGGDAVSSERLRITSAGYVGIGTSAPDTRFTVAGGDMNIKASSAGVSYKLYFGDEVTSGPGKCIFLENYYLKIQGHRNEGIRLQGVNASGVVQEFATFYGDANGSYPSQIHLAPSGGNVGIGTTSPSEKLQVAGNVRVGGTAAYNSVLIHNSGATGGGGILTYQNNVAQGFFGALGWYEGNTNTGAVIGTDSASRPIVFYTSSERMRITGGGSIGIGTSSPLKNLDLRGDLILIKTTTANANFGGPVISIGDTTSEVGVCGGIAFAELLSSNPNSVTMGMYYDGKANKFHITGPSDTQSTSGENLANASKHITVQRDNGNVGIGTASPTYNLTVVGSTSAAAVAGFQNTSSTGYSGAHILNNSGTLMGHFGYGNASISGGLSDLVYFGSIASKAVVFTTTDTEKMRITSGGNIGIATSSPSVLLHLENSNSTYSAPSVTNVPCIYVNNSNSSSSTAHAILALRTLGGNGGNPFISFDINGVQGWAMGIDNADGDKFKLNYGWSSLNSATRLTFETGGNATFSANVTASAFFESSDLRLKSNIYTYTPNSILDVVAKVYEKNGKVEVGYIAQDLKGVLDSAISEREDGYLDLSYRQVHTAKIAALEKEIAELKKQLKQK